MADGDGTVMKIGERTMVFNGGPRLEGSDAPESFDAAHVMAHEWNLFGLPGMRWSWDCGYKLDYDGELVHIDSRFYPPTELNGSGWHGRVCVYLAGDEPDEPRTVLPLKADTLEGIRELAEKLVREISKRVHAAAYEAVMAGSLVDFYDEEIMPAESDSLPVGDDQ